MNELEAMEAKRAARRAAMPLTTALVEQFAEFKPEVIYARENGIRFGRKPEYAEAFTIPAGYRKPVGGWK